MTLEQFVTKYNGKKIDYDNAYGAQCVDLFRQYAKEALGIPEHTGSCSTTGGAKDLYNDYHKMPIEKKYFIRQTKARGCKPGDVFIWDSTPKNQYGHVAILLARLGDSFIVFEQNGITQAGAEIKLRTTEGLLGYLRKKGDAK